MFFILYVRLFVYMLDSLLYVFFSPREQLGTVERSRQKYKAAPLTVEFVPFFYRKSLFHSVFHSTSQSFPLSMSDTVSLALLRRSKAIVLK